MTNWHSNKLIYIEKIVGPYEAVYVLYSYINYLRNINKLDEFVSSIDINLHSTLMLTSIMTITFGLKEQIPSRFNFCSSVKKKFIVTEGKDRANRLVDRLV